MHTHHHLLLWEMITVPFASYDFGFPIYFHWIMVDVSDNIIKKKFSKWPHFFKIKKSTTRHREVYSCFILASPWYWAMPWVNSIGGGLSAVNLVKNSAGVLGYYNFLKVLLISVWQPITSLLPSRFQSFWFSSGITVCLVKCMCRYIYLGSSFSDNFYVTCSKYS